MRGLIESSHKHWLDCLDEAGRAEPANTVADAREDGNIGDEDYAEALRFLLTFYICHKVIGGLDLNQLTDAISKHAYDLEMTYKPDSFSAWKDSFKRKLPASDAMRDSLLTLGWSNHWDRYEGSSNKDRCRLVIELLEEAATSYPVSAEYTIEHVLPDAEGPASALVGNMLPLEPRLNKRCVDKPLEEKFAIYAESNLPLRAPSSVGTNTPISMYGSELSMLQRNCTNWLQRLGEPNEPY